ncbi:MAG: sulfite exporter TauE/SafE family protein [Verrucomicrobiales bacterium]|nr:sulfite exporter TauE/SafE family protein [Verrucomicrobiales bacterium]
MPELPILLAAVAILAVAAFVQSATGFGLALVCVAALPLLMEVHEAVALVAFFNLLVTSTIFWLNRHDFSWKAAWPLVLTMVIGIPLGYYGMHALPEKTVIRVLGGILVAIALSDFRMALKRGKGLRLPGWLAVPAGFTGGILGGAFNIGGPPIVAFAYSQGWKPARCVAILQSCFLAGGMFRNLLMGIKGEFTKDILIISAWAAIPALLAIWLGKKTLDSLPAPLLRRLVFLFVLGMGLKYLVWP